MLIRIMKIAFIDIIIELRRSASNFSLISFYQFGCFVIVWLLVFLNNVRVYALWLKLRIFLWE